MSESTRRGFLKVAGAGAAAGVAAVAVGAATRSGTAVAGTGAAGAAAAAAPRGSGPLVAYVRDVRGAEVSVLVGETEVVVHDADLVARLVNARSTSA